MKRSLSITLCLLISFPLLAEEPGEMPEVGIGLKASDAKITQDDRDHWAFKKVERPDVPQVKNDHWVRNPIDAFILQKLERKGWKPAPAAVPGTLGRRLYLGLTGLPPTLKQQAAIDANSDPEQFDHLVKKLLASEAYGERWARHWLDIVRYAETNGYERDGMKPNVWRYRDYIIRALNDDVPFNQFILEQLAGDELETADSRTVIATGYYRLGPFDDEPADFAEDRFDQLDDMLNTTSQVFLGLTLACARCHDHKFEALTQHDYYKMIAVFNPLKRPQSGRSDLDLPAGSVEQLANEQTRNGEIAKHNSDIDSINLAVALKRIQDGTSELDEAIQKALKAPAGDRDSDAVKLIASKRNEIAADADSGLNDEQRDQLSQAKQAIKALREETPDLPRGYFFTESLENVPETNLLVRGKASSPGPVVQPGVPTVLTSVQPDFDNPTNHTTGRRLALANWIASDANPLTARVLVNRVWQHHFGVGIVRTPNDFGVMGAAPTHEALLDWLADWFVNEGEWSLKKLHALILSSNAYRMSSEWNESYAAEDPENNLLWRRPYRRLEVEAIRDSILAVSGQINRKMYGPSMYPYVPSDALDNHADKQKIWPAFNEEEANRRTIYSYVKRSLIVPFLEVLDLCDTTKSTPQRIVTSVAPQALTLFNGKFVNRQAEYFAKRLETEAGDGSASQITLAFKLALCREPTATELQVMTDFLATETKKFREEDADGKLATSPEYRALVQICRVIFNLNEFAYPD
ncbi:MAG: DUF1549 and DUF1553 domain-containing protein [Pirellulaceae bacterium]